MAVWDDILTERDKLVFGKGGFGRRQGFGRKPALLVIDMAYAFVGDRPEPILQSIERYHASSGEEGWQGIYQTRKLLEVARSQGVPVFYTAPEIPKGRWQDKNARFGENTQQEWLYDIVAELAPSDGEVVIRKEKPSGFFGTPLVGRLVNLGVDTLLVTGCTTSGCVRATVVDAFSYNFKVAVVEEGVFDRGQASHKIALFDMNAKYADVVSLAEAEAYLLTLAAPVAAQA